MSDGAPFDPVAWAYEESGGAARTAWLSPRTLLVARLLVPATTVASAVAVLLARRVAGWAPETLGARLTDLLACLAVGCVVGLLLWWWSGRPLNRARWLQRPAVGVSGSSRTPGTVVGAAWELGWQRRRGPDATGGGQLPEFCHLCLYGVVSGPCAPEQVRTAAETYWWLLWSDSPRGPWRLLDEACRPSVAPDRAWTLRQTSEHMRCVARVAHIPARTAWWAVLVCHGTDRRAEDVFADGRLHPRLDPCVDAWDDWSDQLLGNPMAPVDWKALAIDVLLGHFAAAYLGLRGFLKGTRVSTYIWGRRYAWWGVVYMLGAWWLARSIG